jgi:hypothetical protein
LTCQHLDTDQREVDWVGIPGQVGNLPDLGGAAAGVSVARSSSARPKRPLTGWFVPSNSIRRPSIHEVGQAQVAQVGLEAVADDVGAGDPRVGIEPRDVVGVVMVPDQPSALVVGVVVLRLAGLEGGGQALVEVGPGLTSGLCR